MLNDKALNVASYADCQGCSLCILPCPMWRQHRDVMFSPQGVAKAMQSGAKAEDLSEVLRSCIGCGACDVMCPEKIDVMEMMGQSGSEILGGLTPFVMSCDAFVQSQIDKNDLYIIDAAAFHADYANRVEHYDALRKKTGCDMNLDLNRMAIATGIGSAAEQIGMFDVTAQLAWLLQGRSFQRIVVENPNDMKKLAEITKKPVVCVADFMEDAVHATS